MVRPSRSDMEALLQKVGYELEMLVATNTLLHSVREPAALRNAVVESGLLHLRNLLEFFYIGNQDVSAGDYLEADWTSLRPDGEATLGEPPGRLYGELSSKLSHISTKRGEKRSWSGALANGILAAARVWVASLPDDYRQLLCGDPRTLVTIATSPDAQYRGKSRTYQIRIDETSDTPFVTVSSTRDDNQTVVWAGPFDQIADPLLDGIMAIEGMEREKGSI